MHLLLFLLLCAGTAAAQFRQISGASGSVAGQASSASQSTRALVGQPVVGNASGGEFGTHGGFGAIFADTYVRLDATRYSPMLPSEFSFSQNYPNPFNPSTTLEFALPKASRVSLIVFDQLGREVARVLDRDLTAGSYTVNFAAPENWASGVYFAAFSTREFRNVRKLVLLK